MAKTLTAKYDSLDRARNALDDLINIGLDREKMFLDRDNTLVRVMIPSDIEREVREILDRHGPAAVTERTM